MKILILAGGKGTRLWPLSRLEKPKQFQKLINNRTMLQETVERFSPKFPQEDIFIATNKLYFKEIRNELPAFPKKNIILEPVSRERLASLLLFFATLKEEEFSQPVAVFPSDHLIKNIDELKKAIFVAEKFIKRHPQYIALLGEKPSFPDTGLGYLRKGNILKKIDNRVIHKIVFFKEKPNLKRVRQYIKTGDYFWNTAIYFFTPSAVLKGIKKFAPENYEKYKIIKNTLLKKGLKSVIEKEYAEMHELSLEYSILENYKDLALLPVNLGWSDVGSWTVLKNSFATKDGNFIKGNFIGLNAKNVMVHGPHNKLVAGIGIKDLIVVLTDDIILICNKDDSHRIKEIIEKFKKEKKFGYL